MQEVVEIIGTLGFPIAVAVFVLWQSREHEKYLQNVLDSTLKENTKAVDRLSDLIDKMLLYMKGGGHNEN